MLEIQTVNKGAELVSAKLNGIEKIHDGKNFWNRHSPVLFPIVGKLKNGKTTIGGKTYEMGQHGFARDMEFEKIDENSYVLKSNKETLKKFLFEFELYISYEVNDNKLTTKYKVMAFTIGAIFAGIGGGLFAHCFYIINPSSFTFMASFNFLIMVVLGGLGSITGSIAGAFVVTFVSAALASWPEFRMIIYAIVLILLMFYRPQGLFGYKEITNMKFFQRFKGGHKA